MYPLGHGDGDGALGALRSMSKVKTVKPSKRRNAAVAANPALTLCHRCKTPVAGLDFRLVQEHGMCGDCRRVVQRDVGDDVIRSIQATLAPVFARWDVKASSRQVAISVLNDLTLRDLWITKGKPTWDPATETAVAYAVEDLAALELED